MRFIHTSDWHLGRLFYGRHLTEDQAYVLEKFHLVVKDAKPDAILICGDIYDRAVPPVEAVELLNDTLARLSLDAKAPVIMIAGNHDSPERLGFGSGLLELQGVHIRGTAAQDVRPVALEDEYGSVYFMPYTYAEPAAVRSLWPDEEILGHGAALRVTVEKSLLHLPGNVRKVALAHAFIAGSGEAGSERPLAVGASGSAPADIFASFHYTALGHLHNAQRAGGDQIRYAGSLMKYSFDEARQKKGVEIIDLRKDGEVFRETAALEPRRDVCRIEGFFDDILHNRGLYPERDDYVAVTLRDTQAILDVHGQLAKVYPNLLQIERPYLGAGGTLAPTGGDCRTKSETELFDDFFYQMTGEALSEAQRDLFYKSYEALLAKRREGKA